MGTGIFIHKRPFHDWGTSGEYFNAAGCGPRPSDPFSFTYETEIARWHICNQKAQAELAAKNKEMHDKAAAAAAGVILNQNPAPTSPASPTPAIIKKTISIPVIIGISLGSLVIVGTGLWFIFRNKG